MFGLTRSIPPVGARLRLIRGRTQRPRDGYGSHANSLHEEGSDTHAETKAVVDAASRNRDTLLAQEVCQAGPNGAPNRIGRKGCDVGSGEVVEIQDGCGAAVEFQKCLVGGLQGVGERTSQCGD